MPKIAKLHYLTQDLAERSHTEQALIACKAGISWLQLRSKKLSYQEWLKTALEVKEICQQYKVTLIINDSVEIAKSVNADGVHLGKNDLAVSEARKITGENFIIGGTANSVLDVESLKLAGASYIGLGPYAFTKTKDNLSPVLGYTGIERIVSVAGKLPVIAIGGIDLIAARELMEIENLHGLAISSAINLAEQPAQACRDYIEIVENKGSKYGKIDSKAENC